MRKHKKLDERFIKALIDEIEKRDLCHLVLEVIK